MHSIAKLPFFAAVTGLLITLTCAVWAGECLHTEEYYVQALEVAAGIRKTDNRQTPFLWCLGNVRNYETNRWAGPTAERTIENHRLSPRRGRIQKACSILLDKQERLSECYMILARFGIKNAGKHDTFKGLLEYEKNIGCVPWYFASLGDRRVVPLLIEQFENKDVAHFHTFYKGAERKIEILNTLWHLATSEDRKFVQKVAGNDPSALVRQRAQKLLKRLPQISSTQKQKMAGE